SILHAMTIELATQHVIGVLQNDLHLKNYLVSGRKIYTLDSASMEFDDKPLNKKVSLTNLALFFAQLGVGTDELRQKLFHVYTKSRGWIIKEADVDHLMQSLKNWNQLRKQRYEKKIFRNCTTFALKETV